MIKKITLLLLLLLFMSCSETHKREEHRVNQVDSKTESNTTQIGKPLTKSLFTLQTIEGKTIHIDETQGGLTFHEFKDQIVMFVFFGYRCPPCLAEIPVLSNLNSEQKSDLSIIGVEVQGLDRKKLKSFANNKGVNYHLIVGGEHRNFVNYIIQKANWQGNIPFLLAFDKQGVVKVVHVGGLGAEQFSRIYTQLSQ